MRGFFFGGGRDASGCFSRPPALHGSLSGRKKRLMGERLLSRCDVTHCGFFLGEQCTLPLIGGKTIRDLLLLEFVESTGRWGNVGVYETAAGAKLWQGSGRRRREAVLFGFWV